MSIYCTYLTTYSGNKFPPFYIGSSTVSRISNGYQGSVSSKMYKELWDQEIKTNPHLFKTRVISTHSSGKEARDKELKFHKNLNVVKSDMYVNRALAKPNGFHGTDVSKEKHPRWGQHHSTTSKQLIGAKNKGKSPHNKGVPMSQKNRDRIKLTKRLNPHPAPNKGKKMNYSSDALAAMNRAKTWKLTTPGNETLIVNNLRKFCKDQCLNERALRGLASGLRKHYNGWQCSLIEDVIS
jgi:hypothetical protein